MKKYRVFILYAGTMVFCLTLIYTLLYQDVSGQRIDLKNTVTHVNALSDLLYTIGEIPDSPLTVLLLQIITIIGMAKLAGWLFQKMAQPRVVGEMAAGIILGPSILGNYFPGISSVLFPETSFNNLRILSQIGLILFMFIIGMELEIKSLKNKIKKALVISHISIIVSFTLGMAVAVFLYTDYAPYAVEFSSFVLFLGIAMSINAFPVLARIVQEREIHKTGIGALVITCAAVDDITAWCILTAVIAFIKTDSFIGAMYIILAACLFVIIMLKIIRPFLIKIGELHKEKSSFSRQVTGVVFLVLFLSSYIAEMIGVHALFGAFMAGAIMPENIGFRKILVEKINDVVQIVFLPLFFVFTGLRTKIGLLNDFELWKICGIVIALAIIGKSVSSTLSAKILGHNWYESLTVGILMNTRGLMGMIVLNIGYDLGVVSPEIFSIMIVMVIITTLMTGPGLDLLNMFHRRLSSKAPERLQYAGSYKILLSFDNLKDGTKLLDLANCFTNTLKENSLLAALHVAPGFATDTFDLAAREQESHGSLSRKALDLQRNVSVHFKISENLGQETVDLANRENFDLIFIPISYSIYEGTILGNFLSLTTKIMNPGNLIETLTGKGKTFEESHLNASLNYILAKAQAEVGIFVDKGLRDINRATVIIFNESDDLLIKYIQMLIHNSQVQVTVIDINGTIKKSVTIRETIRSIEQIAPNHIKVSKNKNISKESFDDEDLAILSVRSWGILLDQKAEWIVNTPSLVLFR